MRLVYTHENHALAATVSNYLLHNNIEVITKNQYASGGSGQLAPIETWPEIWIVDDSDYHDAIVLIKDLNKEIDGPQWRCQNCDEMNDATFDYCWGCQQDSNQQIISGG